MREETFFAIFTASLVIVYLVVIVVMIASNWKIHEKAGKPGWTSIVPIYNMVVLLELTGKPLWWIALLLIPFVNIIASPIISILIYLELAKKFGLSPGFGLGLSFLPLIFLPILAFGPAKYQSEDITNVDHLIA